MSFKEGRLISEELINGSNMIGQDPFSNWLLDRHILSLLSPGATPFKY